MGVAYFSAFLSLRLRFYLLKDRAGFSGRQKRESRRKSRPKVLESHNHQEEEIAERRGMKSAILLGTVLLEANLLQVHSFTVRDLFRHIKSTGSLGSRTKTHKLDYVIELCFQRNILCYRARL